MAKPSTSRPSSRTSWPVSRSATRSGRPAECIGAKKRHIEGKPDPKHASTSYVERQNLTMRMHMRRFTRLTNAFSKKVEGHTAMVAIYTVGAYIRV